MTEQTDKPAAKPFEFAVIEDIDQLRHYPHFNMGYPAAAYVVTAPVLKEISKLLEVTRLLNYALRELDPDRSEHTPRERP